MDELRLIRPTAADEERAADFLREFLEAGEKHVPGGANIEKLNYAAWLEKLDAFSKGDRIPEGYVPADTYFSERISDGRIVGIVDIRKRLTEYLTHIGGNIGYSIRPSERGKGYGSAQLRLALQKCAALGIEKALVTCDDYNLASAATAISQGGLEIDFYIDEDNMVQRRFLLPTIK